MIEESPDGTERQEVRRLIQLCLSESVIREDTDPDIAFVKLPTTEVLNISSVMMIIATIDTLASQSLTLQYHRCSSWWRLSMTIKQ